MKFRGPQALGYRLPVSISLTRRVRLVRTRCIGRPPPARRLPPAPGLSRGALFSRTSTPNISPVFSAASPPGSRAVHREAAILLADADRPRAGD